LSGVQASQFDRARRFGYDPAMTTTAPGTRPTFSLVVPIWNEEQVIPELYKRVVETMNSVTQARGETWELVCVNDGSRDNSLALLVALREQDARIKIIDFSRNFGHQVAITAGADFAEGDAVIVMDADLQDPPDVVVRMIEKWRAGYDVVYAQRRTREGETKFKLWTASAFYRLLRSITDVNIPVDTGDFRLMDRRVVLVMRKLREKHRFMRGLSSWVGFKQTGVTYDRAERYAGETKYPLRKMLRLAIAAITSFSFLPLQLATYAGFIMAGISLIGIIITIILRLSGSLAFAGQATTLVAVLFLGGIQLIFLGIIGEYIGRIYDEAKDRPLYVVNHAYGFIDEHVAESGRRNPPALRDGETPRGHDLAPAHGAPALAGSTTVEAVDFAPTHTLQEPDETHG
jgi:dolichol-phosphate mannosyltransferase